MGSILGAYPKVFTHLMLHILLEMPFPRAQLYDVLCLAPHFHGILCVCVCVWISSSQHRQSSGEGFGIAVTCLSLLASLPTFGIFYLLPIFRCN